MATTTGNEDRLGELQHEDGADHGEDDEREARSRPTSGADGLDRLLGSERRAGRPVRLRRCVSAMRLRAKLYAAALSIQLAGARLRLRFRSARRADRADAGLARRVATDGPRSSRPAGPTRSRLGICQTLLAPAICSSSTTRESLPRGCSATASRAAARSNACSCHGRAAPTTDHRRSGTR